MMDMKNNIALILSVASIFAICSCSEKEPVAGDSGDMTRVMFKVSTKTGGTAGSLTRLYVAERLQEHDNNETLHCRMSSDLTPTEDGSAVVYSVENMTAQWYKFAFVSVPDGISYLPGESGATGLIDGASMLAEEDGCDFNSIVIDYSQVLEAQQADVTLISSEADLHVYRKIIDRWLLPDQELVEDVALERVTGRLVLDMGIPEDQFPDEVEYITVSMRAPSVMYLHDEADGEAILKEHSEMNCVFEYRDVPWNTRNHFIIQLDLLPGEIPAATTVTVKYEGSASAAVYNLVSEEGSISIKPSTMTTVRFNGIKDGFREVRYAGFPNDAVVDVAPDVWE